MSAGPLNISIPTSETKTSVPQPAEGVYVKVRFSKLDQDSVEGKGDRLRFQFDLVDPTPNQDGGTITPGQMGSKFFYDIPLYDKNTAAGQPPPKWSQEKISRVLDGFLGTGDKDNAKGKPARPDLGPEVVPQLIGQVSFAKFKNRTGEWASQGAEIQSFTFPGDVAGA